LRGLSGVDMVVQFGTTLHVSGSNAVVLEQALKPFFHRPGCQWTRIDAGLEDVFISLMNSSKDNFQ